MEFVLLYMRIKDTGKRKNQGSKLKGQKHKLKVKNGERGGVEDYVLTGDNTRAGSGGYGLPSYARNDMKRPHSPQKNISYVGGKGTVTKYL
jgi:hypothetical protein